MDKVFIRFATETGSGAKTIRKWSDEAFEQSECYVRRQALISQLREPSEAMVEAVSRSLCADAGIDPDMQTQGPEDMKMWVTWKPAAVSALSAAADALDGGA